jgi:predicted nucleic acid-binding protein
MILVDTSVWVSHLRHSSERLHALLRDDQVLCHPLVVGELACGTLRNRQEILALLKALPQSPVAEQDELLRFVEVRHLYGQGLAWVDVNLLASALLAKCRLWTLDKPLRSAAAALTVSE